MTIRLLSAAIATAIGFSLSIASARADIPPPQQFPAKLGSAAKSDSVLVIRAGGPTALNRPAGSVYGTQRYCHVVLDIDAASGAKGRLTVQGSTTGSVDVGPEGPFIDEIAPVAIDVSKSKTLSRTIVVPLRHNVTSFDWNPSADSSGTLYVWATAIPCTLETDGF